MLKKVNNNSIEVIDQGNTLEQVKEKKVFVKSHIKSKRHEFLLSAKNLYLTYSKCSLQLIEILTLLKSKLSYYIVKESLLVRQYHEDGEPHVHVYLKMLKKQIFIPKAF